MTRNFSYLSAFDKLIERYERKSKRSDSIIFPEVPRYSAIYILVLLDRASYK